MHRVQEHGLYTPPASPSFQEDPPKYGHELDHELDHDLERMPVAAEDRIGTCVDGHLQITGVLGTGAYGVVYDAYDLKTGYRYAVKTLSKFGLDGRPLDRRQLHFQHRELRLHWMASQSCSNIVTMHKMVDAPDCTHVVLEYCPEGDLFYNITECGHYVGQDDLVKRVFLQILDAVEHCHVMGIYHRDLKPENILVSDNGETVKLADFGLAIEADKSADYGCGSTFYMSPECLDPASCRRPYYYCAPNDVWSLGVILVNLTSGRNPWKQASVDDSTYRAFAKSRHFLKTILPITDELDDILSSVFHRNPDKRMTLPELKRSILACPRFTLPAASATPPTPSIDPFEYVGGLGAAMDHYNHAVPHVQPVPVDLDAVSAFSDDGSLISTCSSPNDDELDFQQIGGMALPSPQVYEAGLYPTHYSAHYVGLDPTQSVAYGAKLMQSLRKVAPAIPYQHTYVNY